MLDNHNHFINASSIFNLCDHFYACIYTRELGTPTRESEHNLFDSEKLQKHYCAPEGVRTWVTDVIESRVMMMIIVIQILIVLIVIIIIIVITIIIIIISSSSSNRRRKRRASAYISKRFINVMNNNISELL